MQDPNPSGSSRDDWQRCADLDEISSDDEGSWEDWGQDWPDTNLRVGSPPINLYEDSEAAIPTARVQRWNRIMQEQNDYLAAWKKFYHEELGNDEEPKTLNLEPNQHDQHDHDWQPGQYVSDDIVEALVDALSAKHAGNMHDGQRDDWQRCGPFRDEEGSWIQTPSRLTSVV